MACSRISKMCHWDTYVLLYFIFLYFHFGLLAIFFFKFSFVQNCLYFVLKDIFTTYRISGWQWFSFPFLAHHCIVFWLSLMLSKSQLSVLLLLHWRGCVFRVCGVSFLFFTFVIIRGLFIYSFVCLFVCIIVDMEFPEFMMSFITFRKFTAINSLNISYAPQISPWMPLMDLKLNISKTKLLVFSPKSLFSKPPPITSITLPNCLGQTPKRAPQFLFSWYPSIPSIHLSEHILNVPPLLQLPTIHQHPHHSSGKHNPCAGASRLSVLQSTIHT